VRREIFHDHTLTEYSVLSSQLSQCEMLSSAYYARALGICRKPLGLRNRVTHRLSTGVEPRETISSGIGLKNSVTGHPNLNGALSGNDNNLCVPIKHFVKCFPHVDGTDILRYRSLGKVMDSNFPFVN